MACSRKDSLANDSWGAVKFDEITDKNVLNDVEAWFSSLISVSGDEDVINSTRIDIRSLGNIVASTGASCVWFEAILGKNEYNSHTMLEIGVLRYPHPETPYFKAYRIKLKAWSDSTTAFYLQSDTNGIEGEFSSCRFKPRHNVMDQFESAHSRE